MSDTIIEVENLSKQYRLGEVSTGTVSHDLNRWWARMRGKEDPTLKVTGSNDRAHAARKDEEFVWALKDINFEVKRGEVLGIIGRNGAGKSTLLKILSRVTAPTTGEIRVDGRIASLLEVGTGFHPELTGRENIFLNGAILGMTKAEIRSKLDEIVDFSGCALYLDTPVKRYSSGMVVRLGFAVAAHLEPDILIVDEVLAVGDIEFQKKCIGKMKDVASHGRTVLFVSHNMAAVKQLCTRGVILENGALSERGTAEQVVESYLFDKAEKSILSIADRTDRQGGKVARFVDFSVNGQPQGCAKAYSGKDMTLRFQIESRIDIMKPKLYCALYDMSGQKITRFNNILGKFHFEIKNGMTLVECRVESLAVPEGNYCFGMALVDGGVMLDGVEFVEQLSVFDEGFFFGGIKSDQAGGYCLSKQGWRVA